MVQDSTGNRSPSTAKNNRQPEQHNEGDQAQPHGKADNKAAYGAQPSVAGLPGVVDDGDQDGPETQKNE
jgi:hypothetical protein